MKNLTPVLLFLLLSGSIFNSCSKKGNHDPVNHEGGNNECQAQISDAEPMAIFPTDNAWNQDISGALKDPYSDNILSAYESVGLKADFGSGLWDDAPIGIPFTVVCGSRQKVNVVFRGNDYDDNYGDESDAGPYPIPLNTPIEGNGQGDSHVIAVDKENNMLYELYNASVSGDHWEASGGAVFHLNSNQLRQEGWTSADAAGLPIFPGLVRYDEIVKGEIDHAIRFTLNKSNIKSAYISPARHKVNSTGGVYSLPFGARIRLKAGFDISGFPANLQVILKAMKKYGLMLADVGSNMYISGAPDERWDNDVLRRLGEVKASDFEVVKFND
ncbi:MAG: hypothetical protein ABI687_09255 [Flavitalea sp.]